MKFRCIAQLNKEITYAIEHKMLAYQASCEAELIQTKFEAMNPKVIQDYLASLDSTQLRRV